MFGVSDPAASPLPEGEGAILHAGALQEQGPCSSGLQLPGLQGGSVGGGAGADLRREGERVLAMLSLPVSPSRCASSRNLIYPKIRMLSMWYKWLTFSTWINWRRQLTSWGKAGFGGGCGVGVGGCTATLALSCPLRQSFGVVNGEIQVLALLHLTATTWGAATGWWLWRALFSVHSVRRLSVRNQWETSSLGKYTDPGVFQVFILTTAWLMGEKMEIPLTHFKSELLNDIWCSRLFVP